MPNKLSLQFITLLSVVFCAYCRAADPVDTELVETRRDVPRLLAPAAYQMRDNTVDIELSNYAGYAGLIAANGGLEPTEDSVFFKNFGFKVGLALSEEESWSALNSGKMAASATTTDVLAVYGRQFDVMVPALIGFSRGADGVIVRSEIGRINDLKGKVLATCQFTESDFFLRYLATEAGLEINLLDDLSAKPDPERVNLVFCADGFAAGDLFLKDLQAGRTRLAGCVTWAPKTTEVVEQSGGKARQLVTNRNLLIVADILIVNRQFANANPKIVAGLVEGLIIGNQLVRNEPDKHLPIVSKALEWEGADGIEELNRVHLANLPENLAFFDGTIDSAGSYGFIHESAVAAYGKGLVPSPADSDFFPDTTALRALAAGGKYASQKPQLVPLKTEGVAVENEPILSKNIRFVFEPNSPRLDQSAAINKEALANFARLLQISPGSVIVLRGHAEPSLIDKYRQEGGEALVRKVALTAMQLSKDRAAEVKRVLSEQYGVDASRVRAVGRGWEEPISKKPDENRRVELQWTPLE